MGGYIAAADTDTDDDDNNDAADDVGGTALDPPPLMHSTKPPARAWLPSVPGNTLSCLAVPALLPRVVVVVVAERAAAAEAFTAAGTMEALTRDVVRTADGAVGAASAAPP
jgi:hypothetical protein